MKTILSFILIILTTSLFAQQNGTDNHFNADRPDGHGPISVGNDHVHEKGEWMFNYSNMFMHMDGSREGTHKISSSDVFDQGYSAAPQNMKMDMNMLMVMYAPTNRLTLMAMGQYMTNRMSMDMKSMGDMGGGSMMPVRMNMKSSGFGDASLTGLYKFYDRNFMNIIGFAGVLFPTGSINKTTTMMMNGSPETMRMPYAMQMGSGSWGTNLGATWLWQNPSLSVGAQGKALINFNDNSHQFRMGNQYDFNGWFAVKATPFLSFSLRGSAGYTGRIHGADPELNSKLAPPSDVANSESFLVNSGLGANFYISNSTFKELRFSMEYALPVYRHYDGIQMNNDYTLTAGLSYTF